MDPQKHLKRGDKPLKDISVTFLMSSGGVILVMITSVVLARGLGPEGRGEYAVALRVVGLLVALGQFGLPEAMLYQMRHDRRNASALAANSLVVGLVATVLSALALWVTIPLFSDSFYKGAGPSLLWLAFIFLPSNLIFIFFARIVQLNGRLGAFNLLTLASRASMTVAIIILLTIWPDRASSAITGLVISSILVTFCTVIVARRLDVVGMWGVDLAILSTSIRKGINVQWGLVAHMLAQSSGIFILNYFLDLNHVGLYATALGVATVVLIFPEATRTVLQAWMPAAGGDEGIITERTMTFARQTAIVLSAAALGLIVVGYPLIRTMYGNDFMDSYTPMTVLAVSMVFRGVMPILDSQLALDGYMVVCSSAAVINLLVNVTVSWLLVPSLGMLGAAGGDAIGNVASLIFLSSCFLRRVERRPSELIPRMSDLPFWRLK